MGKRNFHGTPDLGEAEDQSAQSGPQVDPRELMAQQRQQALQAALQNRVTVLLGEAQVKNAHLEIELGQAGAYIAQLESTVSHLTSELKKALGEQSDG